MDDNQKYYDIIKGVIARCKAAPLDKELIIQEIKKELRGYDYLAAAADYLWGAYYNLDNDAREIFLAGVFSELKEQYPNLYDFFTFYFGNSIRRRGFDRRSGEDRRKSYSLDYTSGKFIERRSNKERRKNAEKRAGWTRMAGWTSIPFTTEDVSPGEDIVPQSLGRGKDVFHKDHVNLQDIEFILSSLNAYVDRFMQPGQTAWKEFVSPETLKRTEDVMKRFMVLSSLCRNGNGPR